MAALRPAHYDGVLAFGDVIRDLYLRARLGASAPGPGTRRPTRACSARIARRAARGRPGLDRQLGRRRAHAPSCTSSCSSPVRALGLDGARPRRALPRRRAGRAAPSAGIEYARLAAELRGAARSSRATASRSTCRAGPTSRRCPASRRSAPFEALACGIPLVSRALGRRRGPVHARARTTWSRATAREMKRHLRDAARRPGAGRGRSPQHGRATILRAPHLRPPRRRAAGDRRELGSTPRAVTAEAAE